MTVEELKAQLIEALGETLGRYRSSTGVDEAAVWIRPPLPPREWTCDGIEIVINRDPERNQVNPTSSGYLNDDYWVLRLTQWDRTKSTRAAIELIQRSLQGVQAPSVKEADDLSYEQALLQIYDPAWSG